MQCEIVSFKTADGLELYGALQENKKSNTAVNDLQERHTAIIHIHGMTDHFFESNTMTVMGKIAKDINAKFLTFNNRGAELVGTINHQFYGTALEKFEDCIYDIDAAISFMKKRGAKNIVLSGHSTGCQKIAYYYTKNTSKKDIKNIAALIFLAPADDINVQKKILGKKFGESIRIAKKMISLGSSDMPMPKKFGAPYFSARRYYNLYGGKSIEGHIFNYEENLEPVKKIKIPFLAIFGNEEQYATMDPKKMLQKIQAVAQNKKSQTALIKKADHGFHGQEKELSGEVKKFLTSL